MTHLQSDNIALIIFVFLALISFLVKEGAERAFDKFDKSPTNPLSKLYHIMSFFVRLGLFFILGLATKQMPDFDKIMLLVLFAFIAWPGYNITINLFRKDKWYYVGRGGIDMIIRKIFFFVDFD